MNNKEIWNLLISKICDGDNNKERHHYTVSNMVAMREIAEMGFEEWKEHQANISAM